MDPTLFPSSDIASRIFIVFLIMLLNSLSPYPFLSVDKSFKLFTALFIKKLFISFSFFKYFSPTPGALILYRGGCAIYKCPFIINSLNCLKKKVNNNVLM